MGLGCRSGVSSPVGMVSIAWSCRILPTIVITIRSSHPIVPIRIGTFGPVRLRTSIVTVLGVLRSFVLGYLGTCKVRSLATCRCKDPDKTPISKIPRSLHLQAADRHSAKLINISSTTSKSQVQLSLILQIPILPAFPRNFFFSLARNVTGEASNSIVAVPYVGHLEPYDPN